MSVADHGSFSRAAAALDVDVSAVSKGVHDLEDRLGISLFERSARGAALTTAGRNYLAIAREALDLLERAEATAHQAGAGEVGRLRLGFVWSFAFGPIVALLQGFRAAHPAVAIELVEDGPDALIKLLRDSSLDVVITAIEPDGHEPTRPVAQLERMLLWSERLAVAVPRAETRQELKWDDVAQHDILCRTVDDHQRYGAFLKSVGGPALKFAPQSTSREGLLGLIAAGLGWSIVPESLTKVTVNGVCFLPIAEANASVQIEALWQHSTDNPALQRFLALARSARPSLRSAPTSPSA